MICEDHGEQPAIPVQLFISTGHPDYERRRAEGTEVVTIDECAVCEAEREAVIADVLARIDARKNPPPWWRRLRRAR